LVDDERVGRRLGDRRHARDRAAVGMTGQRPQQDDECEGPAQECHDLLRKATPSADDAGDLQAPAVDAAL
jgi:hypothetical protein